MRRRTQQLAEGAGFGFADGLDQLLLGVHDVGAVAGDRLVEWLAAEHQEDDEAVRRSDGDLLSLVGEKNKAVFRRLARAGNRHGPCQGLRAGRRHTI